ncbi:MAG TPA: membrane dipeptidase [Candidatus Limnocylindria bacterium]|nr:membrane dipeptidase [Candidatus Limnocylindria bacterium]
MTTDTLPGIDLSPAQEERARELHARALVIDGSSVVMQEDAHFERAFAGGVTATNHTVTHPPSDFETAVLDMTTCRHWVSQNSDKGLLTLTVADIQQAKQGGREAIIFGPQNTEFIGTEMDKLVAAYELGVRVLQLTYQRQNWVGAGCGEANDGGLSTFGRALVKQMDELGIVVDLSHCGAQTSAQAIELSANPVIFSHAHPYAVTPHVRAKSDDLLRALAARGGVIGITALSAFLADPAEPRKRAGLEAFARHMEYLLNLIGEDHVGIGLDFDETNTPEKFAAARREHPELDTGFGWDDKRIHDLTHAGEETNVTRVLVSLGLSDEAILKVLGGNFLRVFGQVWRS